VAGHGFKAPGGKVTHTPIVKILKPDRWLSLLLITSNCNTFWKIGSIYLSQGINLTVPGRLLEPTKREKTTLSNRQVHARLYQKNKPAAKLH
jgi:hypothetical protein